MESIDLECKGLEAKVRREGVPQELMSKSVRLCCVRTYEFQGKEMFLALSVALTYFVLFYLL